MSTGALLVTGLYRAPRRFRHYVRWLGWWIAVKVGAMNTLGVRRRVKVEMAGETLWVRTGSPDLVVAASTLVAREYEHLDHANPRFIIDAGANIGASAIWFARRFPEARVVAIEPEIDNFEMLCLNTSELGNVTPMLAALWSRECRREVMDRQTGAWGYTLCDTDQAKATGQTVRCVTVGGLLEEFNQARVGILKLDIEGGEKEILEHAEGWIDRVDAITVELHDRVVMGCARAFYLATRHWIGFGLQGEQTTAYNPRLGRAASA